MKKKDTFFEGWDKAIKSIDIGKNPKPETFTETELREAAKFTAIGEGLLNDLFKKVQELRNGL